MDLFERVSNLFDKGEMPYAPLALAPHEAVAGKTEYARAIDAIDRSLDSKADQFPEHIVNLGKQALYTELVKQANRNDIPRGYPIDYRAKRGRLSPAQLITTMEKHEALSAVELARLTHFGEQDVDAMIHEPVLESLASHPHIELIENDTRRFKTELRTKDMLAISVGQLRAKHIRDNLAIKSRYLLFVDARNPEAPTLKKDLRPAVLEIIDGNEYPEWLIPALTTYFGSHNDRLAALSREHRSQTPNLSDVPFEQPGWLQRLLDRVLS